MLFATVGIVCALGFWLRWRLVTNEPLVGDMITYDQYAKNYRGLYAAVYCERDPFFIALLYYWRKLFEDSAAAYRTMTVALSMILIPATGLFIQNLSSTPMLGFAAMCLMALHPAWIRESVRGLRTELLALEILGILSIWLWLNSWPGAMALGIVLGLTALTQKKLAFITLMPFLWLTIWLGSGWSIEKMIVASLLMFLIYSPHKYRMEKLHGKDWAENRTALYFANLEFNKKASEKAGPLGFYQGPPMTWHKYFFELHTYTDYVLGHVVGLMHSANYLCASLVPGWAEWLRDYVVEKKDTPIKAVAVTLPAIGLMALTWYGAWLCLGTGLWWVPALMLWANAYIAFMYSKQMVEPFRHTARVYPLYLFCLLTGINGFL
jgi:hypothetical protein